MKLIIEQLENELEEIKNWKYSKIKNNNNNNIDNDNNNNNKNKNLFFQPINSGLINHLKKENERLRKLVVSYEFKIKRYNNKDFNKNNNSLYNFNNKFNNLSESSFSFKIIQKKINLNSANINNNTYISTFHNTNKNKDKMEIKINNRDYKLNFSNKSIGTIRKFSNYTKMIKNSEIKKLKTMNMLDNGYNNTLNKDKKRYKDIKISNNNEKQKSLSQKKAKNYNTSNNTTNQNIIRYKKIFNSKKNNKKKNILKKNRDLTTCRSQSKMIRRYDNSFNNSIKSDKRFIGIMNSYEHMQIHKNKNKQYLGLKTFENKKNEDISFDKDIFNISSLRQKNSLNIKKKSSKNKDIIMNKDIYYQTPIINKITIYNSINNESNINKKKNKINEKGKKLVFSKFKVSNRQENKFNNYTFGI